MGKTMNAAMILAMLVICSGIGILDAQPLDVHYYDKSPHLCRNATKIVRKVVFEEILKLKVQAARLLRLFFHDCFVRGCDGSCLIRKLDGNSELDGAPNINSLGGLDVIDKAKRAVERECNRVVSCADIVAMAARDSVLALGGPLAYYDIPLGRKDGNISLKAEANANLPSPFLNTSALIASFASKGLNKTQLVALSGGHTIGTANCSVVNLRFARGLNSTMDPKYATYLHGECPTGTNNKRVAMKDFLDFPINLFSNNGTFDNQYYVNVIKHRGLFVTDNDLITDPVLNSTVHAYADNYFKFLADFKSAIVAMGNIGVHTTGYVRKNCSIAFS